MADPSLKTLDPRRYYLRSLADIQGLEETDFRWLTMRVWPLGVRGNIRNDVKPTEVMSDFIMQNISQMDRERSHVVPGVRDNVKVYFFDREIRQFTIQGFIYDMPFDSRQQQDGNLQAYAYTKLRTLYDQYMRTSVAARKGYIVELDYGQFNIYCTLTNMSSTLTSDTPVIYVVSFVVLVEAVTIKDNIMPGDSTTVRNTISWRSIEQPLIDEPNHPSSEAIGIVSREAGVKIGLADSSYMLNVFNPTPQPPQLQTGVEKALLSSAKPPQLLDQFPQKFPVKAKRKSSRGA